MVFVFCVPLSSCNSNSNQTTSDSKQTTSDSKQTTSDSKEILLTKDNFKDYFAIEVESDIDITKHGDTFVLGIYIPPTYSAVADVGVNVFATSPIDVYNVTVTLEVKTSYVCWNKQTITLYISSNGSASKNLTITTSDAQDIYFKSDCNTDFYATIVSVEGTIREK